MVSTEITIVYLLLLVAHTTCRDIPINNGMSAQIDLLIEKHIISRNCIMIKFGADAITALNTEKGIAVIDAGISTGLTARYRKIIENEFKRNDFVCVINTHRHPDHIGGAGVFPEAGIIAHYNCLPELLEQEKDSEERIGALKNIVEKYDSQLDSANRGSKGWNEIFTQKTRYLFALDDATNRKPLKSPVNRFEDSLTIDMGDYTIEMFFFGKSHSDSDIIIYIPQMKLLFTGDLFSRYGRPGFDISEAKDKKKWLKAVQRVQSYIPNIEKIIDGHGDILSTDDFKSFKRIIEE